MGWWRGEGDGDDSAGPSPATLHGRARYAPAKVGQGFRLAGAGDFVTAPSSPATYPTGSFSIELWFSTTSRAGGVLVSLYECGGACSLGR